MKFVELSFVTSNPGKLRETEAVLGLTLKQEDLELPEMQSLDVLAVARDKSRRAYLALGVPVLVEDTSLGLMGLGGFPGPLVKWLLQAAGVAGLCRLAAAAGDELAVARCAAVIWDGTTEVVGEGSAQGRILTSPRGSMGFGWDSLFAPEWGQGRTYAEMSIEEKTSRSHRTLALLDLKRRLSER